MTGKEKWLARVALECEQRRARAERRIRRLERAAERFELCPRCRILGLIRSRIGELRLELKNVTWAEGKVAAGEVF